MYGVAMISRLLKNIRFFCRKWSLEWGSCAKKTMFLGSLLSFSSWDLGRLAIQFLLQIYVSHPILLLSFTHMCVYICTHVHMCVYMYVSVTHIHIGVCIYVYTMCVYICAYVSHIYTYACVYMYVYTCTYARYIYVCVCIHICVCIYVHVYMYICKTYIYERLGG